MAEPAFDRSIQVRGEALKARPQPRKTGAEPVQIVGAQIPLSVDEHALSPARAMQDVLGREFAEHADRKWSTRRTVAFVVVTCGAFWVSTYFMLAALLG